MGENSSHPRWSDDQWARIRQVVHEEATRTRVGASFLAQTGPLPADTVTVPYPRLGITRVDPTDPFEEADRLVVNDFETKPLLSIAVEVFLTAAQMSDPNLADAILMFRRAANVISRVEDWIIFRGKSGVYYPGSIDRYLTDYSAASAALSEVPSATEAAKLALKGLETAIDTFRTASGLLPPPPPGAPPPPPMILPSQSKSAEENISITPAIYQVNPEAFWYRGLIDAPQDMWVQIDPPPPPPPPPLPPAPPAPPPPDDQAGALLVKAVVQAIEMLEGCGHLGPFACILGDKLYTVANTPEKDSMVLPSDRITPFLNGPLLRTSVLDNSSSPSNPARGVAQGVVVSLAGAPIELVVAQDLQVQFLQVDPEPRGVFRVSEKILLRIKEPDAVVRLYRDYPAWTSPYQKGAGRRPKARFRPI